VWDGVAQTTVWDWRQIGQHTAHLGGIGTSWTGLEHRSAGSAGYMVAVGIVAFGSLVMQLSLPTCRGLQCLHSCPLQSVVEDTVQTPCFRAVQKLGLGRIEKFVEVVLWGSVR
jgi:hypothetical protein